MTTLNPKDPSLLDSIKKDYLDVKIRGEDNNKQLLLLVCTSSFTKNPLSAIVKGPSGAGKSHLVNRVLDPFRKMGIVIEFSRITGAYLENMAKRENPIAKPVKPDRRDYKKDGELDKDAFFRAVGIYKDKLAEYVEEAKKPRRIDLSGKILFIDELRGIQNAQAPKLLISEGRLRLGTVINNEPVEVEVTGTPVIITTTTLAVLDDPEFENRVVPIQIDESQEHTREVLEFEAERYEDPSEDLTESERVQGLVELFQLLKPYDVANPYSRQIFEKYPTKNIEARRDFPKLMNLCNVVTWLYQYQRVKAKKGLTVAVFTDPADIETVKKLAEAPLKESLSGVSAKEEEILKVCEKAVKVEERTDDQGTLFETQEEYQWVTVKKIHTQVGKRVRRGQQWTRDHTERLYQEGYLEKREVEGEKHRNEYRYGEVPQETFQFNQYSLASLEDWANQKGWGILASENKHPQIPDKPEPLAQSETELSPKSEFGNKALPASEFGNTIPVKPSGLFSEASVPVACPKGCGVTFPDKTALQNHLDTYKHDPILPEGDAGGLTDADYEDGL